MTPRVRHPVAALVCALWCGCSRAPAESPTQADAPAARADAAAGTIFRHVGLRAGRVVLGEVVPPSIREVAGAAALDTVLNLPRQAFTGAERIRLHLTGDGRLARVVLDYPTDADLEAMVAEYHELGPGTRSAVQRPGEAEPATSVTWLDAHTGFRLTRDPNRNAWTVRGDLWDRALAGRGP
jgi:hypothetical protein